jgi:hypothetical protein
MSKLLLTIPEASERSGIPYSLLRGAVRSGRLKTVTLSKRPLIPALALDRLIAEVEHASTSKGALQCDSQQ